MKLLNVLTRYNRAIIRENAKLKTIYSTILKESGLEETTDDVIECDLPTADLDEEAAEGKANAGAAKPSDVMSFQEFEQKLAGDEALTEDTDTPVDEKEVLCASEFFNDLANKSAAPMPADPVDPSAPMTEREDDQWMTDGDVPAIDPVQLEEMMAEAAKNKDDSEDAAPTADQLDEMMETALDAADRLSDTELAEMMKEAEKAKKADDEKAPEAEEPKKEPNAGGPKKEEPKAKEPTKEPKASEAPEAADDKQQNESIEEFRKMNYRLFN